MRPINLGKAVNYWNSHKDEIININERQPNIGDFVVWQGEIDANKVKRECESGCMRIDVSIGRYGNFLCNEGTVSKWMPVNESMLQ